MSYCVKCGVKLAPGSKECPLCYTKVINPEEKEAVYEPTFPPRPRPLGEQKIRRSSVVLLLSLSLFLPAAVCLVCDLIPDFTVGWSSVVLASLLLVGVFIIPPVIKGKKYFPVYCLADFAATCGYLAFLCRLTDGSWFSDFALPLLFWFAVLLYIARMIESKTKISRLKFAGVVLVETGFFCLGLELLLNRAYRFHTVPVWSLYPLVALSALGIVLAIVDRDKALKEKLARKFFT